MITRFSNRWFCSAVVAAMFGAASTSLQAADTSTVTRLYDVADLVTPHPSHPALADPSTGNANNYQGQSASESEIKTAKLLGTLRMSLGEDSSNAKAIDLLGDMLVVNEPADVQRNVAAVLDEMRAKSQASTQIQVDTAWVLLPPGPVTAKVASSSKAEVFCRATTVCFNGQTIGLRQTRETEVVSGATPVIGPNVRMNQYSTEIDRPGVTIELTPQLQPSGAVVVDFKAEAMAEPTPAQSPRPTTQPDDSPTLRPDKLVQSIATTVLLTPGLPMIVGGITQDTSVAAGKTMCLVMTATVLPPPTTRPAPLFK